MKKLRILFMGTPDFAVGILEEILNEKYQVVGVVTAPDKPAGRGQKVTCSAVKTFAEKNDLNILQPVNLKDPHFIDSLKKLKADVQVVVAFRMLPEIVWRMPPLGTFNLHASLLPDYRGAAPIHWAIINGEKETGVTTFFIDDKIDTGEIILRDKLLIEPFEDVGSLHERLMNLGKKTVVKTLSLIENKTVCAQPQIEEKELKIAHKLNKENCKINWNNEGIKIFNHIRGLCPFPVAWTWLFEGNDSPIIMKIYECRFINEKHEQKIGLIISNKKNLKVCVSDGFIEILSFQLPGKKRMKAIEFLNGSQLKPDSFVG